jgi:pimeloyl-ACP methyl ester carboxylesterase
MTDREERTAPELVLPGTEYLVVAGRRVRIRRSPGTGAPVLLLHGIGCSLEDWNEQFDLLGDRFALLALDLPGFAHSERLAASASLDAYAAFLPALLTAAGVEGPVQVVGNSLGGAVAMALAAAHPPRVSALVLADPAGFGREVTLALRLIAVPILGRRLLTPSREASTRTVRSLFADRSIATEERIDQALRYASDPVHSATLVEVAKSLGTVRGVRPRWRRRLLAQVARLRLPTLVLWGERDLVLPAAQLAAAASAFPHAETVLLPDTGHMPQIERAAEFAELVGAFLDRHAARG